MKLIRPIVIIAMMSMFSGIGTLSAQELSARPPLDIPMSFAGTYGELRHNHFHGGLDFKTGNKTGDPIHAIKDGYVSRLSVSTTGYGNAIYLNHPDGTMSVYGHMSAYTDAIASRVTAEQYQKKSYSINIYPGRNEFPVKQGDVIGYVGNTGSSDGPHLHMEVRREEGNLPFNYLKEGYYEVPDNMSPVFQRIAVYAWEDSTGFPTFRRLAMLNGNYGENVIAVPAKSYVAVDAIDKMEGTPNKLGVECYKVFLDGSPLFEFNVGNVSYDIDKYIQSIVAPGESGTDLIKTQVDPGNLLAKDKIKAVNDGIIYLSDYEKHEVTIEAVDFLGNGRKVKLFLQRDDNVKASEPLPEGYNEKKLIWYTPNSITKDSIYVYMPIGALYKNVAFRYGKVSDADTAKGILSDVWQFGENTLALHKSMRVSISTGHLSFPEDKLLLARVYDDGKLSSAGGSCRNGVVSASVSAGSYCVAVDTTAPILKAQLSSDKKVPSSGVFRIAATDDFSGIDSYEVLIDGQWTLSALKSNRIIVYLDSIRHSKGIHKVSVRATDAVGNTTLCEFDIKW